MPAFGDILLAILVPVALLLVLPVRVGLRLRRPPSGTSLQITFSTGFMGGLGGLHLQTEASRHHIFPALIGHPIRFLGYRLRAKPPRDEVARQPTSPPPPPEPTAPAEPPPEKQGVAAMGQKVHRVVYMLGRPGSCYLAQLRRIVSGLRLEARGRVGFADPSQTGQLYGYTSTLNALLGRRVRLRIEPCFTGAEVSGILDLSFQLHLGLLLGLTALLAGRVGVRWLLWRFR